MSYDAHKNFAVSAVAVAPSPATTGTSLTVTAGQGALFPTPPFNCTIWPTGSTASIVNAEIVRVTAIVGDVLTIVRMQEGTNARTVVVGDLIANVMSAKVFTDIETSLIPVVHDDITGPSTTTSTSLVDIPNSTVTITNTVAAVLIVWLVVEATLVSGSSTGVAIAVNIDGTDSNTSQTFFQNSTVPQIMTKVEASGVSSATPLSPGTHTVKGRFKVASGSGTAQIDGGEITAMFMQIII